MIGQVLFALALLVCNLNFANSSLTFANHTGSDLGEVTLSAGSAQIPITVGANTSQTVSISSEVTAVAVNGQTVTNPNQGPISLASGAKISVSWTSTDLIETFEYTER